MQMTLGIIYIPDIHFLRNWVDSKRVRNNTPGSAGGIPSLTAYKFFGMNYHAYDITLSRHADGLSVHIFNSVCQFHLTHAQIVRHLPVMTGG